MNSGDFGVAYVGVEFKSRVVYDFFERILGGFCASELVVVLCLLEEGAWAGDRYLLTMILLELYQISFYGSEVVEDS